MRHKIHKFLNEKLGFYWLFGILFLTSLLPSALIVFKCAILLNWIDDWDPNLEIPARLYVWWIGLTAVWALIGAYGITFNYQHRKDRKMSDSNIKSESHGPLPVYHIAGEMIISESELEGRKFLVSHYTKLNAINLGGSSLILIERSRINSGRNEVEHDYQQIINEGYEWSEEQKRFVKVD